jgi:hypothetical protein
VRLRLEGVSVTPSQLSALRERLDAARQTLQGVVRVEIDTNTLLTLLNETERQANDLRALLDEVERLTAERDAAFKRGAEAMREVAASHFEERARQQRLVGDYIMAPVHDASAQRVRALPLPEDK